MEENSKAVLFVLLGQSNATGHGSLMSEEDIINIPLNNVYGLQRKDNQSYDITKLTWSKYLSHGTNLAEEQDNTYSLSNCLACLWQKTIDSGTNLPDLYIVQIAIGAQGVTEKYMWYPDRQKILKPGKLGEVDISLYPFTEHILSLVDKSFKEKRIEYDVMGIHWRGGEEETDVPVSHLEGVLYDIYVRMLEGFCCSLGKRVPIVMHLMACPQRCMDMDPTGAQLVSMNYVNETFQRLSEDFENVTVFDVKKAPHYVENIRTSGIFFDDCCHYTPKTNMWTAKVILEEYMRTRNCRE